MQPTLSILGLSLLMLSGCASREVVSKVTITDLLAHKKTYKGRRVEIAGYYRSGFELSVLFETEDDATHFRYKKGLWVSGFPRPGYEAKMRFVKEGFVRVVGVLDFNRDPNLGSGHLNMLPAELTNLTRLSQLEGGEGEKV